MACHSEAAEAEKCITGCDSLLRHSNSEEREAMGIVMRRTIINRINALTRMVERIKAWLRQK